MRLLQVGVGGWGESWARVVASSPHVEAAGLVDLDEVALQRVGDAVGAPGRWNSLSAAVAASGADAALVAVPPVAHRAVAEAVLAAGLHCLVEKPMAETVEDARAVVRAADAAGRTLMVSQNYRFKRAPQTVRGLIADDAIGRIGAAYVRFFHAPPFTGFRAEMAQPLIVDMAVHHFDQIRGILGLEPVEVRARSFNPRWSWFRGDASANVEFTTADGAVVAYAGSWVSRVPATTWDGEWEIHGERGAIRWAGNRVLLYPSELGDTVFRRGAVERSAGELEVELDPMAHEERWAVLEEFAGAVAEGREPQTAGRDNLRSLELVLAAVESADRGGVPILLDR